MRAYMQRRSEDVRGRREFKAIKIVVTNLRQDIDDEFNALPAHAADLRERLTGLGTLLERDTGPHIDKGAAQ